MKQNSNSRRSRGRGNGKRPQKIHNFDSNGPEGRVRGNAQQVYEKYLALARDASAAGDRVATENYFQHAEHYFRILMASDNGDGRLNDFRNRARSRNQPFGLEEFDDELEGEGTQTSEREGDENRPQQQMREHQDRPERQDRGERQDRPERQERGERHDRGERQDRGDRQERGERQDRGERQERGERHERRNDQRRENNNKTEDNEADDEGLRRTLAI